MRKQVAETDGKHEKDADAETVQSFVQIFVQKKMAPMQIHLQKQLAETMRSESKRHIIVTKRYTFNPIRYDKPTGREKKRCLQKSFAETVWEIMCIHRHNER